MEILFGIIILLFSVIIHEVSHGYAAELQGDPTARLAGRLTLNPIKHIDPFGSVILPLLLAFSGSGFIIGWAKPVPFNPYNLKFHKWGEALVALAGPASNILIALLFSIIIRSADLIGLSSTFVAFSASVVFINILLAIFNLVPVPPLDGSKILFSFLPLKAAKIREVFEQYWFVGILIFLFILWPLVSPIVFWTFSLFTGLSF